MRRSLASRREPGRVSPAASGCTAECRAGVLTEATAMPEASDKRSPVVTARAARRGFNGPTLARGNGRQARAPNYESAIECTNAPHAVTAVAHKTIAAAGIRGDAIRKTGKTGATRPARATGRCPPGARIRRYANVSNRPLSTRSTNRRTRSLARQPRSACSCKTSIAAATDFTFW